MSKLPESPKKMVAGLKLKRRNPRMASARAMVMSSTRGAIQERDDKDDHRGEQSRSGRQAVESVDQVEGVGDCENPDHRGGETDVPREDAVAEQHWDVHDAETAEIQHGGGNSLHREFDVGADAAKIVVDTEQEDDSRGHKV